MEAIAANILLEGLAVNALAQCETPVTLVTTDSVRSAPGASLWRSRAKNSTAMILPPRHWKTARSAWC